MSLNYNEVEINNNNNKVSNNSNNNNNNKPSFRTFEHCSKNELNFW